MVVDFSYVENYYVVDGEIGFEIYPFQRTVRISVI